MYGGAVAYGLTISTLLSRVKVGQIIPMTNVETQFDFFGPTLLNK